ncbi:MAG: GTP-binding protein, partial [Clostridia bacterium]|nr:GTP-binding protein [Clostridia bacterium]
NSAAEPFIKRVLYLDKKNPTALRYLQEITPGSKVLTTTDISDARGTEDSVSSRRKRRLSYKESNKGILGKHELLFFAGGVLCAAAVLFALVFPSMLEGRSKTINDLKTTLEKINSRVGELILTSDSGRIIKDGINTAIIGTPNVGKSSILNTICGEDRAIVTNIEGTTRDVIETQVTIKGCKLNLLDTAGIRESNNQVEQIGVERSKDAIQKADLIFLVLDGSRELEERDIEVINLADKSKTICLINKNDLPKKVDFKDEFLKTVYVSAQTGEGFYELYDFIYKMYSVGDISEKIIITNPRHKQSLLNAKNLIDGILTAMECDTPFDIILGDIEVAISALGEIGGMTVSDEIIDSIFANFCVGK